MNDFGPRIAAIILAAGSSSRFRAETGASVPTKLVAEVDGKPIVRHVVNAALKSQAEAFFVVTGHARNAVENALIGTPVLVLYNPDYESGMASSLRVGVGSLGHDIQGALILLGDMPRVTPKLLNLLIDTLAAHPLARAIVPVYAGERGNPVLLSRLVFPEIPKLTGDQGARKLLSGEGIVEVAVDDASVTLDVDTPAALEELRKG